MINRYNIGGEGCNNPEEILPEFKDLKNAFKECNEFAQNNDVKIYSLVCTPHCVLDPKDYPNIVFSNCGIGNFKRLYTLTRNGDIRYCNHSPVVLGNVYKNRM